MMTEIEEWKQIMSGKADDDYEYGVKPFEDDEDEDDSYSEDDDEDDDNDDDDDNEI